MNDLLRPDLVIAVDGPSGSGKSTLLNLIGTLDPASAGEITIAGHLVSEASDARLSALRAHLIGFVFQQYNLEDAQTATDNVHLLSQLDKHHSHTRVLADGEFPFPGNTGIGY